MADFLVETRVSSHAVHNKTFLVGVLDVSSKLLMLAEVEDGFDAVNLPAQSSAVAGKQLLK